MYLDRFQKLSVTNVESHGWQRRVKGHMGDISLSVLLDKDSEESSSRGDKLRKDCWAEALSSKKEEDPPKTCSRGHVDNRLFFFQSSFEPEKQRKGNGKWVCHYRLSALALTDRRNDKTTRMSDSFWVHISPPHVPHWNIHASSTNYCDVASNCPRIMSVIVTLLRIGTVISANITKTNIVLTCRVISNFYSQLFMTIIVLQIMKNCIYD